VPTSASTGEVADFRVRAALAKRERMRRRLMLADSLDAIGREMAVEMLESLSRIFRDLDDTSLLVAAAR
jgi:hypothetical protein